jgi:hypothetical protein
MTERLHPNQHTFFYNSIAAKCTLLPRKAKVLIPGSLRLIKDGLQQTGDVVVGTTRKYFIVFFVSIGGMWIHNVVSFCSTGSAHRPVVVLVAGDPKSFTLD